MLPPKSADSIPADAQRTAEAGTPLAAALYVVATPIGNLEDLGRRAARILRSVSLIAAEDTRTSRPLLQSLGVGARCVALHAHNEAAVSSGLLARVARGDAIALISDAGTPGVSDPGARIVAAAHAAGLKVVPIPGASAVTTLLSAAGFSQGRFLFEGFLPARPRQRRERLLAVTSLDWPFLLFEAPHRIVETAADLAASRAQNRVVVIGRELTKQFEQIVRLPIARFPTWLTETPDHRRGEFALLVFSEVSSEPDISSLSAEASRETAVALSELGLRTFDALAAELPPRQAARLAARISGDSADALYRDAVQRKRQPS